LFVWHIPFMSQQPVGHDIASHIAGVLPVLDPPPDPLFDPADEPLEEPLAEPVSDESSPPPLSLASSPLERVLDWVKPASP